MATQVYDSFSLFQAESLEWDAPFTGKHQYTSPQSPEETEIQQSHRKKSSVSNNKNPPCAESPRPATRRNREVSNSHGKKQIRRGRSKVRLLHRVKNERTLLQTNELLQQMLNLEESLKSKPKNHSPVDSKKREGKRVQGFEGSSPKGSTKNQPFPKQSGNGMIIPHPKKDHLIQKLEEMEQQFSTQGVQKQQQQRSDANDRTTLEEWKQSLMERVKQNASASPRRQSQNTTAKPVTTLIPATTPDEPSPRRPTVVMTRKLRHDRVNTDDDQASKTSLESYTLPVMTRPTMQPSSPTRRRTRSKLVVMNAQLRSAAPAPKTIRLQSKMVLPFKTTKLQEIVNASNRKQEETEEQETNMKKKAAQDDTSRGQVVDCAVQKSGSIQKFQELREKTDLKIARRTTSFRQSLTVSLDADGRHARQQKISKQGLQTMREARQKRLELLHQRQRDAQKAYLEQQQKRISKLSGGSSNTTIKVEIEKEN
ncbi:unnamed protein product [Cylindrotheca closterium]|uniref:ALMS motif domain-containing protein n=1 Tax=Cylindrotheca closterium TaxID=2856 RepID=A0AAD2FNV9_9STRA|nr:unnamed protein product [Cylindrotheca closterium]